MRTTGSKNKPKTCLVKLSDLNSIFKDNAMIEVGIKYAALFDCSEVPEIKQEHEETGTISFTVNS